MGKIFALRNHHTVFILGAGFSRLRGLPLISDFALRMRDAAIWCEEKGRTDEARSIYEVLKFRLEAASAAYRIAIDLENIEELFSLASAGNPEIAEHVRVAIAATINYCQSVSSIGNVRFATSSNSDLRELAQANVEVSFAEPYSVLVRKLIASTDPTQSSFITFNYDLVLEDALARIGLPWDYGLTGSVERGKFPLLKLHGSVNWGKGRRVVNVHESYEDLRSSRSKLEIVPPTWNKFLAPSLLNVWRNANEVLSTATNIIVIGFSMPHTDLHFKYLLASGMKKNVSLRKIIFVDPNPVVSDRAKSVFNQREMDSQRVSFRTVRMEEPILEGPDRLNGLFSLKNPGFTGY